jgi:hypothetical protein
MRPAIPDVRYAPNKAELILDSQIGKVARHNFRIPREGI